MAVDMFVGLQFFRLDLLTLGFGAAKFYAIGLGRRLLFGAHLGFPGFREGKNLSHYLRFCRSRGWAKSIAIDAEMKSRIGFKSGRGRKAGAQEQAFARSIAMSDPGIKIRRI